MKKKYANIKIVTTNERIVAISVRFEPLTIEQFTLQLPTSPIQIIENLEKKWLFSKQ